MKISYNWLKWYIPEIPEADTLPNLFVYHLCEVEGVEKLSNGDTVFDLNILPNRAHDLLSHQGVARELAGQLGITFKDPTSLYKVPESKPTTLILDIISDRCRRYTSRIVSKLAVGPSPEWVVKHLESIGQKSINNLVDATNIVMFDCGQPIHIFDASKVSGKKICVRNAEKDEKIVLLDGKEVLLVPSDIVICDGDNTPIALAGVKGGKVAEVDEHTTDIIIEVANFDPVTVRKTARRLGLLTDAAKRFENDLSPEHTSFAMKEISGLIVEMCPDAIFEDIVDMYQNPQKERSVSFSSNYISSLLGIEISDQNIERILTAYGFEYSKERTGYEVKIPSLRLDLIDACDMAEEIGRVYGYEKITPKSPNINFTPAKNDLYMKIRAIREKLVNEGYREIITYSFTNKGDREVLASASDKKFLRSNLTDGLREAIQKNISNIAVLGLDSIKVFEIGTVFKKKSEEIHIAYGDKKNITELSLTEFSIDVAPVNYRVLETKAFTMWSMYPAIVRDIAVWVPKETDPKELENIYISFGTDLLSQSPRMVDTFEKEGKTSYAYRLIFQSHDRTLIDSEVQLIMTAITEELQKHQSWEVR